MKRRDISITLSLVCFVLTLLCPYSSFSAILRSVEPKNGAIDFSRSPKSNIHLNSNLSIGLEARFASQLEKDFDLDSQKSDNLVKLNPNLSLGISYNSKRRVSLYINLESYSVIYHDEERKKRDGKNVELKEAFIQFENISDMIMKIGRQRIRDKREWLYDEELDALRILYLFPLTLVELSIFREGGVISKSKEGPTYYHLSGKFTLFKKEEVTFYWLTKKESKQSEENLGFYGVNFNSEIKRGILFWTDFALLRGNSGEKKIRGMGVDAGISFQTGLPGRHSFTLSYASGSGESESDTLTDSAFRQTGLQDNNAKVNGSTRVKYYGEVLDPELSNISIVSLSTGVKPLKNFSLELLFHSYRQNTASTEIRGSGVDGKPDGVHRFLGREVDLAAGFRYRERTRASLVAGYFLPGKAFVHNKNRAVFLEFKVGYTF